MSDERWCPRCGAEYVAGWGECSTCRVALVADRPAAAGRPVPGETAAAALRAERGDDPFVPVWEGPTDAARRIAGQMEAAHIPVDLGDAAQAGHARVEVPSSYVAEARSVLADPDAPVREPTPGDLDGRPAWGLALVVVAALLIALMVLAYL